MDGTRGEQNVLLGLWKGPLLFSFFFARPPIYCFRWLGGSETKFQAKAPKSPDVRAPQAFPTCFLPFFLLCFFNFFSLHLARTFEPFDGLQELSQVQMQSIYDLSTKDQINKYFNCILQFPFPK